MLKIKRDDVPSISGGGGPTLKGKKWRDSVYYRLNYRQKAGDILEAKLGFKSKKFSGRKAMWNMHGWIYANKINDMRWNEVIINCIEPTSLFLEEDVKKTVQERESVKVLEECIELQKRKGEDYQSSQSNVVQAMHYRRGVDTIYDIMHGKMMRAASLLESGNDPNHESLEDTFKDLINYASFAVSYMRGTMDGQDPNNDMFNRPKK